MAELKAKFGTPITVMSTDLNSLAASATVGRAAAEVDNTTTRYLDALIVCQFVLTTGTPGGLNQVEVYGLASNDGTIYSGDTNYSGAGASYTLAAGGGHDMGLAQNVYMPAQSITRQRAFWASELFGGQLPPWWSLVTVVNTNIALAGSGSSIVAVPLTYESV